MGVLEAILTFGEELEMHGIELEHKALGCQDYSLIGCQGYTAWYSLTVPRGL